MLFGHPRSEKNQTEHKQINRCAHLPMGNDLFPGFLHTGTPVDIVKDEHRIFLAMTDQHIEVIYGGLVLMIPV
jgi:hypothetical protein